MPKSEDFVSPHNSRVPFRRGLARGSARLRRVPSLNDTNENLMPVQARSRLRSLSARTDLPEALF